MNLGGGMDWFKVITELERGGVSQRRIAEALGVSVGLIPYWKERAQDTQKPLELKGRHERALLELHAEMLKKLKPDAPMLSFCSLTP